MVCTELVSLWLILHIAYSEIWILIVRLSYTNSGLVLDTSGICRINGSMSWFFQRSAHLRSSGSRSWLILIFWSGSLQNCWSCRWVDPYVPDRKEWNLLLTLLNTGSGPFTRNSSILLGHEVLDLVNHRIEALVADVIWLFEGLRLLYDNDSPSTVAVATHLLYFPDVIVESTVIRDSSTHTLCSFYDLHSALDHLLL